MSRITLPFLVAVLLISVFAFAGDLSGFMPEKVGELHRIQLITGDAAQAEVDKLHCKALAAETSVVARYSRPSDVGKTRPSGEWQM